MADELCKIGCSELIGILSQEFHKVYELKVNGSELRVEADTRMDEDVATLMARIQELGRILNTAKLELALFRNANISGDHIPAANQELEVILAHTASATNEILDVCELIDPLAKKLDAAEAAEMMAGMMRIYTACGFQDLVGQRIRKILRILMTIDTQIQQLLDAFGGVPMAGPASAMEADSGAKALMNGPQLPKAAMSQSEIDRLLAGD
jgi:chemotaxis protein CheZ